MAIDTTRPQSRRALLAGALGGVAAAVASAIGRPLPAGAAAGSTMIIGSEINNAGSANTQLQTNSSVVAFKLLQNGPGTALMGYATPATGGTRGVYGRSDSPNGYGVQARNGAAGAGTGAAIQAIGGNNHGLEASTDTVGRYAIIATQNAPTLNGGAAIHANGGANSGVWGTSSTGYGVHGFSSSNLGVHGDSDSAYGVYGHSSTNVGTVGESGNGTGVWGLTGGAIGVYGTSTNAAGAGVQGLGQGSAAHGVVGSINTDSSNAAAVYGESAGASSFAGYFVGKVTVTGTLSKGGGSFRIDHPLDPANRILQHSFVESPDMLNIYNGVVKADGNGEATVSLPAWFMALNRDFRYGLTPIGEFAPLYVKAKVAKGAFSIAGAKPGQEVSWQLTGIRRDAWAEANRIEVELDKTADQRGRYLHPLEHGQPVSKGADYPVQQRLAATRPEAGTAAAGS